VPFVLPLHPRTKSRLRQFGLTQTLARSRNVRIIPPAGYFDFLALLKSCRFVLTDSGGIQEEACSPVMRKRVFVMRASTERPEAVRAGYCKVVGTDAPRALREIRAFAKNPVILAARCPYGQGDAAQKIASILKDEL
jgi:UDP-N-acetylglucosamine 2-epimerase (non-hydrolysing)